MEAGTPPISAGLWGRLRALDRRCEIFMQRRDQWLIVGAGKQMVWSGIGGPPSPHRRAWHVRINLRGSASLRDMLDAQSERLGEALAEAVELAERRQWHRADRA